MPLSLNNPKIGLETRRWLAKTAETGKVLDRPCLEIISPALEACSPVHPGGLIHDLAVSYGAEPNLATLAGSIAQLFYCGCSFTDDLHDGDTDKYLKGVPMSLRMNAQLQLLCLVSVRAAELFQNLGPPFFAKNAGELDHNRVLSIMLTGQRLELTRDGWNAQAYERVAQLSAGEQYGYYFALVAAVSDGRMGEWRAAGRAFGNLLQLVADRESRDDRLLALGEEPVERLRGKMERDLVKSAAPLGRGFEEILRAMLARSGKERN